MSFGNQLSDLHSEHQIFWSMNLKYPHHLFANLSHPVGNKWYPISPLTRLWKGSSSVQFTTIFFLKDFICLFLERGKGRERNINMIDVSDGLPFTHPGLGTWPATQACALTWNWTSDLSSLQAGVQSTEPHQPGLTTSFRKGLCNCWQTQVKLFR